MAGILHNIFGSPQDSITNSFSSTGRDFSQKNMSGSKSNPSESGSSVSSQSSAQPSAQSVDERRKAYDERIKKEMEAQRFKSPDEIRAEYNKGIESPQFKELGDQAMQNLGSKQRTFETDLVNKAKQKESKSGRKATIAGSANSSSSGFNTLLGSFGSGSKTLLGQ